MRPVWPDASVVEALSSGALLYRRRGLPRPRVRANHSPGASTTTSCLVAAREKEIARLWRRWAHEKRSPGHGARQSRIWSRQDLLALGRLSS
jgi:hypothetical protein